MQKYKEYMKNRTFTQLSFFIVFTATLLYIAYFIVKNFNTIAKIGLDGAISIIGAFSPLWIGLILAYLLNPLVDSIDQKLLQKLLRKKPNAKQSGSPIKKYRIASIVITYLSIILVFIGLIYGFAALIMGRIVFTSIPNLLDSVVGFITTYESEFQSWSSHLPSGVFSDYINNLANTFISWLSANFSPTGLINHIASLGSGVFNFGIGIVVSIYLLADKSFFIGIWNKLISLLFPKRYVVINDNFHEINNVLSRFVRGIPLDAFLVGILSSIGLSIMGLKFAVFIGIFAGVSNVIPYFGPLLGMIPAFFVGIFTENIFTGIIAVLVLFGVQQIDANIIYPRVVGSSTGLKPLFVLLAVSIGGHYQGILGMIIAVPIASIIQVFTRKWAKKREQVIAFKINAKTNSDNDINI